MNSPDPKVEYQSLSIENVHCKFIDICSAGYKLQHSTNKLKSGISF